jgi:hypothetical protein
MEDLETVLKGLARGTEFRGNGVIFHVIAQHFSLVVAGRLSEMRTLTRKRTGLGRGTRLIDLETLTALRDALPLTLLVVGPIPVANGTGQLNTLTAAVARLLIAAKSRGGRTAEKLVVLPQSTPASSGTAVCFEKRFQTRKPQKKPESSWRPASSP